MLGIWRNLCLNVVSLGQIRILDSSHIIILDADTNDNRSVHGRTIQGPTSVYMLKRLLDALPRMRRAMVRRRHNNIRVSMRRTKTMPKMRTWNARTSRNGTQSCKLSVYRPK
jgi:hypothetical protein